MSHTQLKANNVCPTYRLNTLTNIEFLIKGTIFFNVFFSFSLSFHLEFSVHESVKWSVCVCLEFANAAGELANDKMPVLRMNESFWIPNSIELA